MSEFTGHPFGQGPGAFRDFRYWLRREILKKKKSHRTIAKEAGLHKTAFTEWLTHYALPSEESCEKLATYFNVDVDYIRGLVGYNSITPEPDFGERARLNELLLSTPDRLIPDILRIAQAYVLAYRRERGGGLTRDTSVTQ